MRKSFNRLSSLLKLSGLAVGLLATVSGMSQTTVTVGNGTATVSNTPAYGFYNYSYTQTILTSAQINAAPGFINSVSFYWNSGSLTNSDNWTVYVGNTNQSSFNGLGSWIPTTSLTQVFSGTVSGSAGGWLTVTFTSPFPYLGGNLVIAVDENQSGYTSSYAYWRYTSVSSAQTLYSYSDNNNIDPNTPPTSSGYPVYAYTANRYANVQLDMSPFPACTGIPNPGATIASDTAVCANFTSPITLSLFDPMVTNSGIRYQWQTNLSGSWANMAGDTSFTATLNGAPDTTADFRCLVYCDSSGDSSYSVPVTIDVIGLPTLSSSISEMAICNGDTLSITVSGADEYVWTGSPFYTSALGDTVNVAPTAHTTYNFTGTDTTTGCFDVVSIAVSPIEDLALNGSANGCFANSPVTVSVTPSITTLNNGSWEYRFQTDSTTTATVVQNWSSSSQYTFTAGYDVDTMFYVSARSTACGDSTINAFIKVVVGFGGVVEVTPITCVNNSGEILVSHAFGQSAEYVWYENNFNSGNTGIEIMNNDAAFVDGRLVLTPSASSKKGGYTIPNTNGVSAVNAGFEITFNLTADQPINNYGTGGGDGFAYSFGDNAVMGTTAACSGFGNKLRVSFDAADNGGEGNYKGIYVSYGYTGTSQLPSVNATTLAYVNNIAAWKTKTDVPVKISITGTGLLSLTVGGELIFADVQLPQSFVEADKSEWNHLFSAHTGGDALRHAIDNLSIKYNELAYGITQGANNASLPASWQSAGSFDNLTVGTYNVWMSNPSDSTCSKMLGTYVINYVSPVAQLGDDTTFCIGNELWLMTENTDTNFTYTWSGGSDSTAILVNESGTYWVLVVDTFGCTAFDEVEVIVANDFPQLDLGSDTTVCGELTLDAENTGAQFFWSSGAVTQTILVNTTGQYLVTVTNPSGCESTDAIQVSVNETPELIYLLATGNQAPYVFNAIGATGVLTYHWDFGDGNTASTTTDTISHSYVNSGSYSVAVYAESELGCESEIVYTSVNATALGINPLNASEMVAVYPNPALDILHVNAQNQLIEDVYLRNIQGGIILAKQAVNKNTMSMDVDQLPAGVYILEVKTAESNYQQRVVIK